MPPRLHQIKQASLDELAAMKGISKKAAGEAANYFKGPGQRT